LGQQFAIIGNSSTEQMAARGRENEVATFRNEPCGRVRAVILFPIPILRIFAETPRIVSALGL
jgi:hypothetical protein